MLGGKVVVSSLRCPRKRRQSLRVSDVFKSYWAVAELPFYEVSIAAIYLPLGLSEKLDKYDFHIVTGWIECLIETSI